MLQRPAIQTFKRIDTLLLFNFPSAFALRMYMRPTPALDDNTIIRDTEVLGSSYVYCCGPYTA